MVGRLERLTAGAGLGGSWRAEVSYHADTAGGEITQLINVIFGNTSMKEGVMVADVRMPASVLVGLSLPGVRCIT
jgi:ribulose-bisphosphate carboxylase large chain